MPIPDVAFITTLTIIFLYAALLPLASAECPTCPCTIEPIFKLTNQTNGNCRYEAPRRRFVFECVYWLTGELNAPSSSSTNQSSVPIPPSSPLCPVQVLLSEAGCAFYTMGGVHD